MVGEAGALPWLVVCGWRGGWLLWLVQGGLVLTVVDCVVVAQV